MIRVRANGSASYTAICFDSLKPRQRLVLVVDNSSWVVVVLAFDTQCVGYNCWMKSINLPTLCICYWGGRHASS